MTRSDTADVTLIVVTYNSSDLLPTFFSVLPAALAGVREARVVVVDNASHDATVDLAREHEIVDEVVELDRNRGYAAGINEGMRVSGGSRAYLVLNPDVRLGTGSVAHLLRGLDEPTVGIVVPRLFDEHGDLLYSLRRRPSIGRSFGEAVMGGRAGRWSACGETIVGDQHYRQVRGADWSTGGAMLVSAECVEQVGAWDESFFLYEEEVDFALRAADAGYELRLQPEATAVRIIGDEPPRDEIWALIRINKLRLYGRRHGAANTLVFWLTQLLGELLRSVKSTPRHRRTVLQLALPSRFMDSLIRERFAEPQRSHVQGRSSRGRQSSERSGPGLAVEEGQMADYDFRRKVDGDIHTRPGSR